MLVVFTYLVTRDIVETLERKIGYELSENASAEIIRMENEFLSEFWSFIPEGIEKKEMKASLVSKELEDLVPRNGLPIISLDRVYAPNIRERLEITRTTNPITGTTKITERPGYKSINKQIDPIRKYNEVVLVDVGAFEGATLLEVCDRLERKGIYIKEIYDIKAGVKSPSLSYITS